MIETLLAAPPIREAAPLEASLRFYDEEVRNALNGMERVIKAADRRRYSMMENMVTQFSTELNPLGSFVRHAAMLRLFERRGVLDQYYENPVIEREGGWDITLDLHGRRSRYFQVRSRDTIKDGKPKGVQRVVYFAN
jgi:hypothetical protein